MGTDWQAAAFTTDTADRPRAEAGIRAAYTAAGLPEPEHFVWVPSPMAGAVTAAVLAGHAEILERAGLAAPVATALAAVPEGVEAGGSVREVVRTRPWERARTEATAELGPQGWARAWAETGAPLWSQVNDLVTRVRQALRAPVDGSTDDPATSSADGSAAPFDQAAADAALAALRGACVEAVLGQHDAPWLALFDSLDRLDGLSGLAEAARSAGWWWPYERLAIVSGRPVELHRDEPGRLHRGDGPALAYADGFALHAWRGMPVPAGFIASLDGLSPARIDAEENAELRRVMLEIFGYDRYLAETGARPVHKDETGVLWRIDLPGDEPVAMVEVVNSTPEPDGTYRTYYLRVPPATRTAREGVAWTFGVDEADYRPEQET
ncbi:DUF6745 domain-containing protein [Actinomadura rudentiformis]|uniref:DUF6745 domain-containing protein n=1 Tax=Actinomadura rudentiformis TaxID=359158 RepID=A0A6H9YXB4_9ACTN|nr:hypothetical protein [Actinomadura rudentiformis]KAB2346472.1 hypothetical protein F8566_23735 [Actinomadura rudentiformis]